MDSYLFSILLSSVTLVIAIVGGFCINYLNKKIGSDNFKNYSQMAVKIVMAIEQSNPHLNNLDKKELAIKKLLEFTDNKLTKDQIELLIESAVYEIKKLSSTK